MKALSEVHFTAPLPLGIGKACGLEQLPHLADDGTVVLACGLTVAAGSVLCWREAAPTAPTATETAPETPKAKQGRGR